MEISLILYLVAINMMFTILLRERYAKYQTRVLDIQKKLCEI